MASNNEIIGIEESNFFKKLLERYLPYWPIFVLFIAIGLSAAYLYLRYEKPIYLVKAKLYIKDDKAGSDQAKLFEALNVLGDKKTVANEIESNSIKIKGLVVKTFSDIFSRQTATESRAPAPVPSR